MVYGKYDTYDDYLEAEEYERGYERDPDEEYELMKEK